MCRLSRHLDHVGVFARSIDDVALLTEVLAGHDPADPDTRPIAKPALLATSREAPPVAPKFFFVKTAAWPHITPDAAEAYGELCRILGAQIEELPLGEAFDDVAERITCVMNTDLAMNLAREYRQSASQLSPKLRSMIQKGRMTLATDYIRALGSREQYRRALDDVFDNCNAILTPAAPGEAGPIDNTGNPAFAMLWTLMGVPAVTIPLLTGTSGLPLGVQLAARHGDDARLLRTARWLADHVAELADAKGRKRRK